MTDQPTAPPPPPQNAAQAVGQAVETIVGGLRSQPLFLGIIVLNALGIGAALWVLNSTSKNNAAHLHELVQVCLVREGGGAKP